MAAKDFKRKLSAIFSVDVASISVQFTNEAGLEDGAELPERTL